jgi:hypothetical protein
MGKRKTIDAIAMVRRIREAHYEHLKEKSVEERLAFYREKSASFRAELERKQREQASE